MTNGEKLQSMFPNMNFGTLAQDDMVVNRNYSNNDEPQVFIPVRVWNSEYKEPTNTIDYCVSRKEVFEAIDDCNSDGLKGIFCSYNDGERFKEYIKNLSLITPQEPIKGEWLRMSDLSEQEDDRYKCSRCGNVIHHKNKMNLYTFNSWCGRCGSNNGRHINYEVEE